MPLLTYPKTHFGGVYLTRDGTNSPATGVWMDWDNFDGEATSISTFDISISGVGAVDEFQTRRSPVFTIPWCPYLLWKALHDARVAGGQFTAAVYHPRDQGAARTFTAEYLSITSPPNDSEWNVGDPIPKVQVRLANVGA